VSRGRRRSVALAAVALVLGLLALTGVGGGGKQAAAVAMRHVVSVRRPLAVGQRITASDLAVTSVPAAWSTRHQLADPLDAIGLQAAVALPAGAPLMDSELIDRSSGQNLRDLTLRLDDAAGIPLDPPDGTAADLYVVQPGRPPRISLVLRGALVIASRSVDGATVATVRVDASDVEALIEAESAGSLRLVGRGA
jgi:Flp pilus assembly protein CpaB